MSDRFPRRRAATIWIAASLTLVLVGCTGGGSPASPSPSRVPAAPSASAQAPAPSGDLGALLDVGTLLADVVANDGKTIRVTGSFLADAASAQLCAALMESYPPQCANGIQLKGQVPQQTLDALTTTTEPDLNKMWWGNVNVTGTFHASGPDGRPMLDIVQIEPDDSGA